jgi:hypothetical protein
LEYCTTNCCSSYCSTSHSYWCGNKYRDSLQSATLFGLFLLYNGRIHEQISSKDCKGSVYIVHASIERNFTKAMEYTAVHYMSLYTHDKRDGEGKSCLRLRNSLYFFSLPENAWKPSCNSARR